MKYFTAAAMALVMLPGVAWGQDAGELLTTHLYEGTSALGLGPAVALCEAGSPDACFAAGLFQLVMTAEQAGRDFYRYGATMPGNPAAAMIFGIGMGSTTAPLNPTPEPLTYDDLRVVLSNFVLGLDTARGYFERGSESGDYVLVVDPLRVRLDLNGDGVTDEGETLGALIAPVYNVDVAAAPPVGKSKGGVPPRRNSPDTTIGFDRADGLWFAGYTQVSAAPVDLLLAHDFSGFFNAYLHNVFPGAGLPMQDQANGTLFMDPAGDAGIADIIAAIHTLDFPVVDAARLAGVLERLQGITSLSRRNWEAILAETDDQRELVPSPGQTSLMPDLPVTEETVAAWMATLDTVDQILAGELLVPHWRFAQGFDLPLYFRSATETDLVMLLTGYGALPYLKEGPVADADSFAEANRVFGTEWLTYIFWFN
jgi:hypothetical protein